MTRTTAGDAESSVRWDKPARVESAAEVASPTANARRDSTAVAVLIQPNAYAQQTACRFVALATHGLRAPRTKPAKPTSGESAKGVASMDAAHQIPSRPLAARLDDPSSRQGSVRPSSPSPQAWGSGLKRYLGSVTPGDCDHIRVCA